MKRLTALGFVVLAALLTTPIAALAFGAPAPAPSVLAVPHRGPSVLAVPHHGEPSVLAIPQGPFRPHFRHGFGAQVYRQPVWVQPQWAWNGWQWVWVPGYWGW
jgi:hypothetical protein